MAKLADAFVSIRIDTSKLKAGLSKARDTIKNGIGKNVGRRIGQKIGRALGRGINRGLRKALSGIKITITKLFTALLRNVKRLVIGIVAAIGFIGVSSIKMASDVQESENLFDVAMGDMAASARAFSEDAAASLGLFAPEVRKMTGTFFLMIQAMGVGRKQARDMSIALTQLTFDMSSFRNLAPADIFVKISAALSGEVEPMRRLGLLINETAIKVFAFKNGIGAIAKEGNKLRGELTQTEKVIARFGLLLSLTDKDQGDLARTMENLANQARRLANVWKKLKKGIGELFVVDTANAFAFLSDVIEINQEKIIGFVQGIKEKVTEWIIEQGGLIGIWNTIAKKFGEIKAFIVNELIPVFKILWDITKRIAETISDITTKGIVATISANESGRQQLEGGGRKVSQHAFGKDPADLTEKQNIILQSMLDEIRMQTRNTAPI